MDHVAIMKKSWGLIPKILSGEKTIESRWYQTRRAPWNNIKAGDRVFFKNSGEPIEIMAQVAEIKQFEIKKLSEIKAIVRCYGKEICLLNTEPETWGKLPKYCILVYLKNPRKIAQQFDINKRGFGMSTAWISVPHIGQIKS